jgi:hypothetical protein
MKMAISCTQHVHLSAAGRRPSIHKVHQIEEALLIPSRLRGSIDSLDAELGGVVAELPTTRTRQRISQYCRKKRVDVLIHE